MKWLARSMAAATVVLWAFVFPWGQTVLTWLDPIAASLARYGIAAVALLALALPSGQLLSAFRQNWRSFVAIGALGITCLQFLLFFSLNYTSALNASVIMALTPVITMAGAAMFLHEPLSGKALLGMAVSAAGALLAVLGDSPAGISGFTLDRGEPLALLAAVCMAFYTIGSRRLLDHRVSPIVNTALVVTMGLLGMLPLAAFGHLPHTAPTASVLFALAGISIGAAVIGLVFWTRSIQVLGVSEPNVLYNFIPVLTMLISRSQGTRPYAEQIVGAVLVVAGVTQSVLSSRANLAALDQNPSHAG